MLGRSRSGCAMPSSHVFLLSSIAAYTVSRAPAVASVLLMIAAPQMLMKTAIVGGLDQPPSWDLFVTKARQMSRAERRALVEREAPALPISPQCRLLAVSRASVYRRRAEISEEECTIMALIDRQYLARPDYGSRGGAGWVAGHGAVRRGSG